MSVLEQALNKLDKAVAKAERAMGHVEVALSGQQRDMFGEPITHTAANGNANADGYINGAVVAEKLNQTIQKMEGLLQEA